MTVTDIKEHDGYVRFELSRAFDTGDENDFVIESGEEINFGWVMHTESSDETLKHNLGGQIVINFGNSMSDF